MNSTVAELCSSTKWSRRAVTRGYYRIAATTQTIRWSGACDRDASAMSKNGAEDVLVCFITIQRKRYDVHVSKGSASSKCRSAFPSALYREYC
eukprot:scaffold2156_cov115-Cylindrotheca_fusiformis.AAC.11